MSTTPSLRSILREEGMTPVKGQPEWLESYEGFGLFAEIDKGEFDDYVRIFGSEHLDGWNYPGGKLFFDNEPDKLRAYIKDHKERLNKKENGE